MDMRRIGTLEVSVVGLGTNNFGLSMQEDEVPPVVDAALASGINFFDTADSYLESEERLGRALGRHREEVVIGTKFGSPLGEDGTGGAAPSYVREAVERSLRRLGTDRIDLYPVSYTHLRAHETDSYLVCRLLLEKKKKKRKRKKKKEK